MKNILLVFMLCCMQSVVVSGSSKGVVDEDNGDVVKESSLVMENMSNLLAALNQHSIAAKDKSVSLIGMSEEKSAEVATLVEDLEKVKAALQQQPLAKERLQEFLSYTQYPQVYFSPGGIQDVILSLIDKEKKAIRGAVYFMTNRAIARAFANKSENGVKIRLIVDEKASDPYRALLQTMLRSGVKVYCNSPEGGLMHHKFLIFYNNVNSSRLVLTGSYNFTNAAENNNCENIVILNDEPSIKKFIGELMRIGPISTQLKL
jgi:phosphatidylserine/phosphatidylglycerophosphate/cardiolipin synthase-like enzyme